MLTLELLLLLCLNPVFVVSSTPLQQIASTWNRVGVLSQGNFDTIHHIAPNGTPVIASSTQELYNMVLQGQVDVGLLSGSVTDPRFETIPSGAISPRAVMTRKGDIRTRQLMDAAIVRLQHSGLVSTYAQEHAPFEYVEVHLCRADDPDKHLPFNHQSINHSLLHIGSLGPYNWHQDGDYTQSPPVGFWPSFYDGLDDLLVNHTFVRKWYSSSAQVMDALLAGEIDATEGYWTVDSFYQGMPRTWFFDPGCTTLGYESTFFYNKRQAEEAPNNKQSGLPLWLSIVGGVLCVTLAGLSWTVYRERQGQPLFTPLQSEVEQQHSP